MPVGNSNCLVLTHKVLLPMFYAALSQLFGTYGATGLFGDHMIRTKTHFAIYFSCSPPCLLLALVINERFTFKEVLWTFSLYLEAVAILPQLVLLQRTRNIDNLTGQYVFLLGAYRALYILNWIYRYFTEEHYVHWITWIAGTIQTLLYGDFFYYYFQSWKNNVRLELPA
ncbi:ER lumen protein-retaining receptor [Prunus yedoensis var. nudiflora]|uniref:ER lumen protein-retaining receptor n=1 Tax=Prunus yedoensis var. nudiflora TaxID=2094558 RepID=A0A315AD77_PRUYE|nr:ER lumen protein-retaining receptor [Prunus yedoensis var. nudiflora]